MQRPATTECSDFAQLNDKDLIALARQIAHVDEPVKVRESEPHDAPADARTVSGATTTHTNIPTAVPVVMTHSPSAVQQQVKGAPSSVDVPPSVAPNGRVEYICDSIAGGHSPVRTVNSYGGMLASPSVWSTSTTQPQSEISRKANPSRTTQKLKDTQIRLQREQQRYW